MNAQTAERLDAQTPGIFVTEFLHGMVKGMVRKPDEAVVYWAVENGCVEVDIEVALDDVGRLIGHKGSNARAMRTILDAVAAQSGFTYQLNLPHGSDGGR